jgi:tetratricopeptide (TPR) repeat protein
VIGRFAFDALILPPARSTIPLMRIAFLALSLIVAAPALAQVKVGSPVDALYERLARAKSPEEAKGIAGAIERAQLRSGSDTADLLMSRAVQALQGGNKEVALRLLTSVVTISPDYVEGWNKRATLYFMQDDYVRAVADIAETIKREPRHFGAWMGLGAILKETGEKKRAYEAFKRALVVYPQLEAAQKAVDELKTEVEGRDI